MPKSVVSRSPGRPVFLDARAFISALLLGLVIGVCGFGLDCLVHHASRIYASDLYTCIVATALSYLVLIYEKRRRMILARRMEIAAEVNHHIRNALTAIIFSASVENDKSLLILKDATERIDWVLTTVLPALAALTAAMLAAAEAGAPSSRSSIVS